MVVGGMVGEGVMGRKKMWVDDEGREVVIWVDDEVGRM